MELVIMRHGDAEPGPASADPERRLSALGEAQADTMGCALADLIVGTNRFLSSPYTRARQTAERLLQAAGSPAVYQAEPRLVPGASATLVADVLQQLGEPRIWLFSHMPLVGALVDWLVDGTGPLATRLDPAEVVCLEADDWLPGCARIAWRRHYRDCR